MAVAHNDQRRMDIITGPGAGGPGAYRGLPLFCDITVVSPLTRQGSERGSAANVDGRILSSAAARKRRRYSDVVQSGCSRLLVLGCETFGRWSADAISLIRDLARLKAREAPPVLRAAVQQAWSRRWWGLVSVGCQRAVGEALLAPGGGPDLVPGCPAEAGPTLTELVSDYC